MSEGYEFGKIQPTVYKGKNIDILGIKNGDSFDSCMEKVGAYFSNSNAEYREALKCFFPCPDGQDPLIALLGKLCKLGSGDIVTDANLFSLGNNTSKFANDITQRSISYSAALGNNSVNFQYNMNDFISALPAGVTFVSANVVVKGVRENSNPVIAQTTQPAGGIAIPIGRVPATVDFTVRVNGDDGNADFTTKVSVIAAQNIPLRNTQLLPRDVSSFDNRKTLKQTDYNEILASNISNLQAQINGLTRIPIDNTNIAFADRDLNTVVQTLIMEVEQLKTQVNNL